ncbi:MAG: gliding motility-associated C-terminal domain-containing protein [Saprospiraceae bacterium]|nr:gliding motility-associated C-terminal domain-containing protein [Saprospiraceae bacterium]
MKNFLCIFWLVIGVAWPLMVKGQEECGHKRYWHQIEQDNQSLISLRERSEENFLHGKNALVSRTLEEKTLPIVFHIIHQGSIGQVTDDEVKVAIQLLNDAFSNKGIYYRSGGESAALHFCLAQQDDKGNSSSGINRVESPLTDVNISRDDQLKRLINWDPLHCINIYVVNSINGGGVAGYAYLPFNHGSIDDGIVVVSSVIKNQFGGAHSTLVHEMGHYLGLYHTFEGGCNNQNCNEDGDKVCDTPPDGSTADPGYCEAVINSCSTDAISGFTKDTSDINWNYLDYSNRKCRMGFTLGQAERMHYFIKNSRFPLLSSIICETPCTEAVASFFVPDSFDIVVGKEMSFQNQSTNATEFSWLINGVEFSTDFNAQYIFTSAGTYEITLIAKGGTKKCRNSYSVHIEVKCGIQANIIAGSQTCKTGETIAFSHPYTFGKKQEWHLNGNLISTSVSFTQLFSQQGRYIMVLSVWEEFSPSCIVLDTVEIEVVCDADAQFIASSNFPKLGNNVDLQLVSTPKVKTYWSVDGQLISSQQTASYVFNSLGSFQVCAVNESNYCIDTNCQIIFVIDTSQIGCNREGLAIFGTVGNDEAYDVLEYNGKFIMAGTEDNIASIFSCNTAGEIGWKTKLDVFNGKPSVIRSMVLDGDDLLVCGHSVPYEDNFVLKLDLSTFSVVWFKLLDGNTPDQSILVHVLNGPDHYYAFGQSHTDDSGLGCDALVYKLRKSDGQVILHNNFDLGSCETFFKAFLVGNAIYCVGRFNNAGGGLDKFRGSLTKLDLNAKYDWSRLYVKEVQSSAARLYASDVTGKDGSLWIAGHGDLNGTTTSNVIVYLINTDLEGKAIWQKQYDITGLSNEYVNIIKRAEDAFYLLCNGTRNGGQDVIVIKTDLEGKVIWSKIVDGGGNELGQQLILSDGMIHIVGKTNSRGFGNSDMLYFSLDSNGQMVENECYLSSDITVLTNAVGNTYDDKVNLKPFQNALTVSTKNVQPLISVIQRSPDCNILCKDTCQNGVLMHSAPDVVIQNARAYCAEKKVYVEVTLCNLDSVALPLGNPISIYDDNPLYKKANVIFQHTTDREVAPYSCYGFDVPANLLPNRTYYIMANDDGSAVTPIDLSAQFPTTGIEECDYENNLFTLEVIIPESPELDLGPDRQVCDNTVIELFANATFVTYNWSDGGHESTTTVGDPGKYWLVVKDGCGFEQSDTIIVTQLPNTSIEMPDTINVCEGNPSISVFGNFNNFQWYPVEAVSCDTCQETTLLNNQSKMLYIVAVKDSTCFSTDSVFVKISSNSFSNESAGLCEGDTLIFNGQQFLSAGNHSVHLTNALGCDSMVNLTIVSLPKPKSFFNISSSCPASETGSISWVPDTGQKFWLDGVLQPLPDINNLAAKTYKVLIESTNGCQLDTQLTIAPYARPLIEAEIKTPPCLDFKNGAIYFLQPFEIYDAANNWLGSDSLVGLFSGSYALSLKNEESPCLWDTLVYLPAAEDSLWIEYEDTIYLYKGESHHINLTHNANSPLFSWFPDIGLSCTDCGSPEVKPIDNIEYTVVVTDENGCTAEKRIIFIVKRNIEVANVIRLNSGVNGNLVLHNLQGKYSIQLKIFDRWGNMVHQFNGDAEPDGKYNWDGTLNGKAVEEGVYVGVLHYRDEKGEKLALTFDITILK